jgi:protease PrsW
MANPYPAPTGGSVSEEVATRQGGLGERIAFWAIVVVVAGAAIGLLLFLGFNIGVQALVIGLVAAILPVPVLVSCYLWLDRYGPEPARYLALTFFWGAFVATGAALAVNTFASYLFDRLGWSENIVAVGVAPVIEETMKALGPALLLLVFRRREVSGITDGLVYCGLSAVGFAMVENILYLGGHGYATGVERYGPASGAQSLFVIFIGRILLTGFAHPLFTSMTGIGLGIALRSPRRSVRILAPVGGLLLAMMLHGTWNLMPTLTAITGEGLFFLYGFVGLMVPVFLGMIGLAVWVRAREGRLTERKLPLYARYGWFSPPEVAALGTLARRHAARRWARRVAGESGLKAMRHYQSAATRLAVLRDGLDRGLHREPADLARVAAEERTLLDTIARSRSAFVGRDPVSPHALWDGNQYHLTFPDGTRRSIAPPAEPVVPIPVPAPPPMPPPYPGVGWQPGYR